MVGHYSDRELATALGISATTARRMRSGQPVQRRHVRTLAEFVDRQPRSATVGALLGQSAE